MTESARQSVAFVGVGANVEPEKSICAALTAMANRTRVVASSTFYRTKPVGGVPQPDFINGVWRLRTNVGPTEVRDQLLRPIEMELGRRRDQDKWGPRTIDLDLLLYDDMTLDHPELILPHPDLSRPFVRRAVEELLRQMAPDPDADLAARIRRLLPERVAGETAGEALNAFSERLRRILALEERRDFAAGSAQVRPGRTEAGCP